MNREIYIFGVIDEMTGNYVVNQLMEYDRQDGQDIKLYINSVGGSVLAMFAIVDAIRVVRSNVVTVLFGEADSAAAVVFSAGNTRLVSENSRIMIHEVSAGAYGKIGEMKDQMKEIALANEKLLAILTTNVRNRRTYEDIKRDMSGKDFFLSADEAIEYGLADEKIDMFNKEVYKLSTTGMINEIVISDDSETVPVQIMKAGEYKHMAFGKFTITGEKMAEFKNNFYSNVRGIDISIDYTHDNDGGEKKAAGWIKTLSIKDEMELWADVEFTPTAREMIAKKEYRYFSPEFTFKYTNEKGETIPNVLLGGTLTNRPFIKGMSPIKLSESEEVMKLSKEELILKLSEEGVDVASLEQAKADAEAKVTELTLKIAEAQAKEEISVADNVKLSEEIAAMKAESIAKAKEDTFNALVKNGKVVPAMKDDVFATFDSAEKIEAFYAKAPAVVAIEAKGDEGVEAKVEVDPALVTQAAKYGLTAKDLEGVK